MRPHTLTAPWPWWFRLDSLVRRRLLHAELPQFTVYATHLPILASLARWRKTERVVELGSGTLSTPAWLDKQLFPDLRSLISLEDDPAWLERVRAVTAGDPRLDLRLIEGRIAGAVPKLDVAPPDIVFIDDSTVAPDRARTIAAVAAAPWAQNAWIVVHDFETPAYQEAARAWPGSYRFAAFRPETALLWRANQPPSLSDLRQRDRALHAARWQIPVTDRRAWNDLR